MYRNNIKVACLVKYHDWACYIFQNDVDDDSKVLKLMVLMRF